MPAGKRFSIYLTEDEVAIADATAARLEMSRSEVIRHLILYQGMCGGDFPLTVKLLALPAADRDRLVAEIRRRTESRDPIKPQSFRAWVKETLGSDDQPTLDRGADTLIRKLLD
ncbi:CopG family transcriptional regulator [Luteolibacter marinus]|uniref:ribbon-helix-helix domain-containing protein n=1 Tax=Luteolibacter marinus TaxID=2776705 RepID=UPI001865D114|nr:CopG family transcriptional regulator [Luteolibacter marinus]